MNTRHIATLFLAAFIAIAGACSPVTTVTPDEGNGTEQPEKPGTGEENPGGEEKPGEGNKPEESGKPGEGENPGGSENPGGGSTGETVNVTVLNPGATRAETKPTPLHPDLIHNEEYHEFYNPLQDYLDDFGNIDYVCAQGKGTDWPRVLDDYSGIRFYQSTSASKNGGYIRVRAHNGAKLLSVTVGSATLTKIAHSVDGRAKKSETKNIDAGGSYTVEGEYDEVCFYCMGTAQSERWEMNSIKVRYRGGFIEEDFQTGIEKEYGPLVRVDLPLKEGFETGFPTTDKPSYYKYGLTAGRENLQWSTWFGSFSWQNPITGKQSAQLRIYKEDPDYYGQPQFGHLKMEYFIENLSKVSFSYWFSEFWVSATVSYCEFDTDEWKNPQQIALKSYSDRKTKQSFTYDLGAKVNAKIRIQIDPDSGHPDSDHHDLIFDAFIFE